MILLLLLLIAAAAAVQQHGHPSGDQTPATTLIQGLGSLNHPIATSSREAQRFFNQGLTLVYAFNHDEAIRAFRRAAELDPASPMPHWGIALALGPNINLDVDREREQAARSCGNSDRRGREDAEEGLDMIIDPLRTQRPQRCFYG